MFKTNAFENSKRKSSRSKADLFEVLVAIGLNDVYKLKKDKLERDKRQLESIISKFANGERRTVEQYQRAGILVPALVEKLKADVIPTQGNIRTIDWVGRNWREEETLSDLDLTLDSGSLMGISLKSTRRGLGTQKNLGYDKLKQHLGLNIDKELRNMWKKVRRDLYEAGGKLAKISTKSQDEIKNTKYRFPIIKKIGKRYGTPVQVLAIDKSVELFNTLPKEKKLAFLEEILGIKSTKPVLNALVVSDTPKLYWNKIMRDLVAGELIAKKIRSKSYGILADEKPIVRLQASFTNGIGLSAFCERAFLL